MNENYKNAVQLLSNISIYTDDDIRFQLLFLPASKKHMIHMNMETQRICLLTAPLCLLINL